MMFSAARRAAGRHISVQITVGRGGAISIRTAASVPSDV